MFGMEGGPMDWARSRVDSWRAHPFQNGISSVAGLFGGPMASMGLQRGFDAYNNNQFDNSAGASYQHGQDQGNQSAQAAMGQPLAGPLGLVTGMPGYVGGGYDGGPSGMGGGGGMGGVSGGYNSPGPGNQQNWSYGQFNNTQPPSQSSFVDSILNSIGPNGPGMNGQHMTPEDRRDNAGGGDTGMPGNYGVSNFMVGGSPVISGFSDPNQGAMMHHYFGN